MDETLNGFLVAARENEAESLNENTQMVCLLEKMTAALRFRQCRELTRSAFICQTASRSGHATPHGQEPTTARPMPCAGFTLSTPARSRINPVVGAGTPGVIR
jgi:hypothetical protein